MASFEIRWVGARVAQGAGKELGGPQVVRAADWMEALGEALERYGLARTTLERAVCLLHRDGTIDVADPDSNTRFEVRQVEGGDEPADPPSLDSAELHAELASLAALDAPEPRRSQAFEQLGRLDPSTLEQLRSALDRVVPDGGPAIQAESVLDVLLRYVPAESASVLHLDADSRRVLFLAVRGPAARSLRGVTIPAGRGIVGLVLRTGTSLLVREVAASRDHYGAIDQAVGYRTRTLLAVPYRRAAVPCGVVELLNPFGDAPFTETHRAAAELAAARLEALLQR